MTERKSKCTKCGWSGRPVVYWPAPGAQVDYCPECFNSLGASRVEGSKTSLDEAHRMFELAKTEGRLTRQGLKDFRYRS